MNKPEVLILDEPTVGLDPENVAEIRQLIKSLAGERTIILSSHILSEVSMICNKVMIMDNGEIKAADTPKNLGLSLQKGQIVHLKIQGPPNLVAKSLEKIPGVRRIQITENIHPDILKYRLESDAEADIFPDLNIMAYENKWVLREATLVDMTLEEIFLNIVRK